VACSSERDGKRFDAYVAFPPCSPELAAFALQALPRVLEDACGYKLFIAGRDCTPGTGETRLHIAMATQQQ